MKQILTTLTLIAAASTLYAQPKQVNVNSAQAVVVNPSNIVVTDYVAWKRYQEYERKFYTRTQPGAPLSPFDTRSTQPIVAATPSPDPAIEHYNAFLRSKGINSNTIGNATVVNGKMVVPAIK